MKIHAISTGTVTITTKFHEGRGNRAKRLVQAFTDSQYTEPLPIWCWVIEHPEGVIVIDAGIPANANDPIWFPPHLRLMQRSAIFDIADASQEIGGQLRSLGITPDSVRWVIQTHMHQDHDGGLQCFPNAKILVAREEWAAGQGVIGKMTGYMNHRWHGITPTLLDHTQRDPIFDGAHTVTKAGDVRIVPTRGHSAGHQSVIIEDGAHTLFFAGDTSYSQALLIRRALDGVAVSAKAHARSQGQILALARQTPVVYLPSHEWEAKTRLENRVAVEVDA